MSNESNCKPDIQDSSPGIIYAVSNPCVCWWAGEDDEISSPIKIGVVRSTKPSDLKRRLAQLSATNVLFPFILEYAKVVENCREVERRLHKIFGHARVVRNREFFFVDKEAVVFALDPYRGKEIVLTDNRQDDVVKDNVVKDDVVKDVAKNDVDKSTPFLGSGTDWCGCDVPVGVTLESTLDNSVTVVTADGGLVEYKGEITNLNRVTSPLREAKLGLTSPFNAKVFWKYGGVNLHTRRLRKQANGVV